MSQGGLLACIRWLRQTAASPSTHIATASYAMSCIGSLAEYVPGCKASQVSLTSRSDFNAISYDQRCELRRITMLLSRRSYYKACGMATHAARHCPSSSNAMASSPCMIPSHDLSNFHRLPMAALCAGTVLGRL